MKFAVPSTVPRRIHYPQNVSNEDINTLRDYIQLFEKFISNDDSIKTEKIQEWIDFSESIKHYWVQEFSKNPDAAFYTSVYFSWIEGRPIKMGPVWDFDLAYGGHLTESTNDTKNWHIKNSYWNKNLFKNSIYTQTAKNFWKENREIFLSINDTIDSLYQKLLPAAPNNFKKWDILKSTIYPHHKKAYNSYDDAIKDLKNWITNRFRWIDTTIN